MENILKAARNIKCLITDVDGVLTDGQLIYDASGHMMKAFHVQDGFGLKALQAVGFHVGIISARRCKAVSQRAKELGIQQVYQGQEDKREALTSILNEHQLDAHQVAYVGDDFQDLALIRHVGLGIAVANAHPVVRQYADWQTLLPGGSGAIRECCDLLLRAQGHLPGLIERYSQW